MRWKTIGPSQRSKPRRGDHVEPRWWRWIRSTRWTGDIAPDRYSWRRGTPILVSFITLPTEDVGRTRSVALGGGMDIPRPNVSGTSLGSSFLRFLSMRTFKQMEMEKFYRWCLVGEVLASTLTAENILQAIPISDASQGHPKCFRLDYA